MMMTWSNLLSTRALPIEQIFGGLDRMYVWHRWFGALSVGAMWLHLEMIDDVKGIRGASRDIAEAAEELAETGSTLLYILVGISLLRWLPSRWWRLTHKLLVLPYAFACWHFYTSTKPYANVSFWGLWFTGFMLLGLAAWIYRVLWRDMVRRGKLHRVSNIEHVGNIISIELEAIGEPDNSHFLRSKFRACESHIPSPSHHPLKKNVCGLSFVILVTGLIYLSLHLPLMIASSLKDRTDI
jgi:predicted ferric reductase